MHSLLFKDWFYRRERWGHKTGRRKGELDARKSNNGNESGDSSCPIRTCLVFSSPSFNSTVYDQVKTELLEKETRKKKGEGREETNHNSRPRACLVIWPSIIQSTSQSNQ